MSTKEGRIRDGRTENRTPAPAGRISRILAYGEAKDIGIAPWLLEEVDGDRQNPLANAFAAQQPAPAPDTRELEQRFAQTEQRLRLEAHDAADRARREAEARFAAKLENEVEPWLRRMAATIEDIATVRHKYIADSEEKVVRLAIAIARRILHREMQVDPLALQGLLHAALEQSELREVQKILLNPQDLEALKPHIARLNLPPRVEIAAERSLERGALLIESTGGTLDASVDSQLDEVERGFIDMLGRK